MIFFGEIIRAPSSLDLSTTCPIWLFELDCIEFIVYYRVRVWVHVVDGSRITTVTTRYHIHDWTASQNNSQRIELNVLKLENWSLFCSTPVTRTFDSFMVYYFPLKFNFFPRVICRHSSTPIYIQIIFRQPQHAHIHRSPNVWREYWGNRLINRHTLELTMATFRTSWQTHTTNQLNGIATVGAIFERNRTVKQQYLITSLAGWIKLWATKRERKKTIIDFCEVPRRCQWMTLTRWFRLGTQHIHTSNDVIFLSFLRPFHHLTALLVLFLCNCLKFNPTHAVAAKKNQ